MITAQLDAYSSVVDILESRAENCGRQVALVDDRGNQLSFEEWYERSARRARVMQRAGIPAGARIGLIYTNAHIVEYAIDYFAAQLAGGVACPIAGNSTARETETLIKISGISWTVSPRNDFAPTPSGYDVVAGVGDDLAQITFTSGSTGAPKCIGATAAQLLEAILPHLAAPDDVNANASLFIHSMPIGTNAGQAMLLHSLTTGEQYRVLETFTAQTLFDEIEAWPNSVGLLLLPPMATEVCRALSYTPRRSFGSVDYVGITGGSIHPATAQKLPSIFPNAEILTFYTTSETWPAGTSAAVDGNGSSRVGVDAHRHGVLVVDEAGERCEPNQLGEIVLPMARGGGRGYVDLTGALRNSATGFRTGDLGYVDEAGDLFLVDRISYMINSGGAKISPREVENVIASLAGVDDICVFAVPHESLEELVVAAVVLNNTQVDLDQLTQHCAHHLSEHKIPKKFLLLDQIPLMPSGKPDVRGLRELAETSSRANPAVPLLISGVAAVLRDLWSVSLDRTDIAGGSDFFDLGGNSLSATKLAADIHHALGVEIDPAIFIGGVTFHEMLAHVEASTAEECGTPSEESTNGCAPAAEVRRFHEVLRENLPADRLTENPELPGTFLAPGLNSVEIVQLVVALEREFGFTFADESLAVTTFQSPSALWAAVRCELGDAAQISHREHESGRS